jgi:hypothetical protein
VNFWSVIDKFFLYAECSSYYAYERGRRTGNYEEEQAEDETQEKFKDDPENLNFSFCQDHVDMSYDPSDFHIKRSHGQPRSQGAIAKWLRRQIRNLFLL